MFSNNGILVQEIRFLTGATKLTNSVIKQASGIYNKLYEKNFAKIRITGEGEDSWSRRDIIQLAKIRSRCIRDFFIGIGCKSNNIKLDYNGVPKIILFKPKAQFSLSGQIDLNKNLIKELKEIKFDNGTKDFQPTNLEITKINIDNFADNVIPGLANAKFNIRFNNKHSSNSIKKKINKIIKNISKKNKSKFKIDYRVSGEAFLTKPNNTTYMIQDIIKKVTKIKPKLSTTGGTSDARFIRKIAPCLEFGLVGKTMHKVDEAVSLSDLKKLTLIYSIILKNYFK